jgi:hypothetical protein
LLLLVAAELLTWPEHDGAEAEADLPQQPACLSDAHPILAPLSIPLLLRGRHMYPLLSVILQVLASPTTKDFTNVMLFLYRQFDPVLPKTFKLEEEVCVCFQLAGWLLACAPVLVARAAGCR